jgi:signal peptidase I
MKAGSMEPTIMQNETVRITGTSEYRPHRGDIVAYRVDDSIAPGDKIFVHRCVAVEGDEFLVRKGDVYLNGNKLTEPYIHGKKTGYYGTPPRCEGKVPAGMIVVLGDNRDNARDSRVIGFVAVKNVVGKVEKIQ